MSDAAFARCSSGTRSRATSSGVGATLVDVPELVPVLVAGEEAAVVAVVTVVAVVAAVLPAGAGSGVVPVQPTSPRDRSPASRPADVYI